MPVPHAWLDNHPELLAAFDGDYEAAALADFDDDGHATWQEHVAGSDPEDADSVLRGALQFEGGVLRILWQPDLGDARVYTVEGKAALDDAAWGSTNSATRFFRIRVEMP